MDFYTIIFINNVVIAERIYRFILCIDDSILIITFNYEQIRIAGRINVLVIKWDTYFVFAVNDTFLLVFLYNEEAILGWKMRFHGYRTALLDDPQLTNRLWYGSSPIRVVLDPQLALPPTLRLFTDGLAPTWVVYLEGAGVPQPCEGVRYLPLSGERIEPQQLLQLLYKEGILSLLIEGGAATLSSFLSLGLYDRLLVEVASKTLGEGVPAPAIPSVFS